MAKQVDYSILFDGSDGAFANVEEALAASKVANGKADYGYESELFYNAAQWAKQNPRQVVKKPRK